MRKLTAILMAVMLIICLSGCGGNTPAPTAAPTAVVAAAATASPLPTEGPIGGDWRVMKGYGGGEINDELAVLFEYNERDDEWVFYSDEPSKSPLFYVDGSQADNPGDWDCIEFDDLDNDGNNEIVMDMDPLVVLLLSWNDDIFNFDFYDEDEQEWFFDGVYRPFMDSDIADVDPDDDDIWRANGLPPSLDTADAENFDESIISFATVSINKWFSNADRPYIQVLFGTKDGVLGEPSEFYYGIPQVSSEAYIEYLEILYGESYISNPYVNMELDPDFDLNDHDVADWFFETELLHRDMVFYVWDDGSMIGTGHIAKMPEFITYSGEVFIQAEFKMDNDFVTLEEDVGYIATTAEWDVFPEVPEWLDSGYEFEIDIDGDGLYVVGEARSETKNSETWWYLDIIYLGEEYSYELGDQYEDDLYNYVLFMDINGDGRLEMMVNMELEGGWGEEVVFFEGSKPVTVLSKNGSY